MPAARFTCDSSQAQAELPLKRLSRVEYVNTVTDLVASLGLPAADRDAVLAVLSTDLARVPADRLVGVPGETRGGFTRLDQLVQQGHVDVAYDVATHLGAEVMKTPARRAAVLGACATDASSANDAQCLSAFITKVGALALRRPVRSDEATFVASVAGTTPVDPAALSDVLALLASMPQFLYHVEEGDPAAAGPTPLDAWALASRLSYHFWQTAPDQALRDAAASGALLTAAGYQAQVDRLFADPRSDAAIASFFREWFRLDELQPLDTRKGTPVFDAFAGADLPASDLAEVMKQEVTDLSLYVARAGQPLSAVLTSRKQVAKHADLARLYGAAPWDGVSTPQDLVEPARSGLLTRAAFLANPSGNTRPVMKGLRIRTGLLCETVPPPPPTVKPVPPELSPDLTTREEVEALTGQAGTSCAGCHSTMLNPLGFLTEDFDALGRHRASQTLYNADGTVAHQQPIETAAVPNVAGVTAQLPDSAALTQVLVGSQEFEACFSRQYFRFAFDRLEDTTKDGCALSALQSAAVSQAPLATALKAVALRDEFKRRDLR